MLIVYIRDIEWNVLYGMKNSNTDRGNSEYIFLLVNLLNSSQYEMITTPIVRSKHHQEIARLNCKADVPDWLSRW
jgi:hypothetical protein